MMRKVLLFFGFTASVLAATAQETLEPKVKPETLVAGKEYVLVNQIQKADQYMSRTSWDGAFYFQGKEDSNYASHALKAINNGDGTWSFIQQGTREVDTGKTDTNGQPIMSTEDVTYYFGFPSGSPNVNLTLTEPVLWIPQPKKNNFYHLILGKGNNPSAMETAPYTSTGDLRMHLNRNADYFVVNYIGGPFFGDIYGEIEVTANEDADYDNFAALDSASFYWGFVQVDNLEQYMEDLAFDKAYRDPIEKFKAYSEYEDYAEGFSITYEAAAKAYKEAVTLDDLAASSILDILSAKENLYKAIEEAIGKNEEENEILTAAIATAKAAFDSKVNASEVNAALQTLTEAVLNYELGTGEITAFGQNMSFEDLASQDGNQTSGVAAPPVGWNVYVNGTQVTTADEVRQAGITAWHGVNADSSGDIKQGNYAFGIWTSGVPTYEISQTIKGLDNGTYEITAGLMAGSNGNGSRLTTQRIFGNLNSTYYGSDYDYDEDELDKTEVYDFAYNPIIQTDTEMQPVTVRAFVYDGTLTFGVRTDGNVLANARVTTNSAGGDGWFKVDNFRIMKLGYLTDDALNVFEHYYNVLSNYETDAQPMAAGVLSNLQQGLKNLEGIGNSSSQEDIISAIKKEKTLIEEVQPSVKLYEKLGVAIEEHYSKSDEYQQKTGYGDYIETIQDVENDYLDGKAANEEEVNALIDKLNEAMLICSTSDEIEEGQDLTSDYLQNPSFEDLSAQNDSPSDGVANAPKGWNLYINGTLTNTASGIRSAGVTGWCAINGGDQISVEVEDDDNNTEYKTNQYSDGTHLWGIWNDVIPEVELSQTLKNMPSGTYTLSCDVLVQYNWAGYCITTQRIFANDYVAMYSYEGNYENNMPNDALIAADIDRLTPEAEVKHLVYAGHECESPRSDYSHTVSLTFGLAESGDIKIGFRTNNVNKNGESQNQGKGWFKLDNWRLTYDSYNAPVGADVTAEATGIEDVSLKTETNKVAFYSASGIRRSAPNKGINIVKMADGTVKKVLVK